MQMSQLNIKVTLAFIGLLVIFLGAIANAEPEPEPENVDHDDHDHDDTVEPESGASGLVLFSPMILISLLLAKFM